MRWDFADDLEEEAEKWRQHIADLDAHKPFRDFRYRAASRDGVEIYVSASGKPLFDPEGNFLGYRGVASHITAAVRAAQLEEALQEARKQAEKTLRESEQRFRDFTESASDWYWETGPDHRLIAITNQPDTIGIMPASRTGVARWEFALDLEEEPEKWRQHIADLNTHKPFRDFRYRAISRNGSKFTLPRAASPCLIRKDVSLVTEAWPATYPQRCARRGSRKHCRRQR